MKNRIPSLVLPRLRDKEHGRVSYVPSCKNEWKMRINIFQQRGTPYLCRLYSGIKKHHAFCLRNPFSWKSPTKRSEYASVSSLYTNSSGKPKIREKSEAPKYLVKLQFRQDILSRADGVAGAKTKNRVVIEMHAAAGVRHTSKLNIDRKRARAEFFPVRPRTYK